MLKQRLDKLTELMGGKSEAVNRLTSQAEKAEVRPPAGPDPLAEFRARAQADGPNAPDALARYRRMQRADRTHAADPLAPFRRPKGAAADASEHNSRAAQSGAPREKAFENLLRAALQPPADSMQKHIDSMLNSRKG